MSHADKYLFKGPTLLHLDPPKVERADVRIRGSVIVEVAPKLTPLDDETVLDMRESWLMPGLVCGHTHVYSALACGMPFVDGRPSDFHDMLAKVWWRLDRGLDEDGVFTSAAVAGVSAVRCGVTTLIDHHASPNAIAGSLDRVDEALDDVGLRRILCYEVTDRGGPEEAKAGLDAHRALLEAGPNDTRALLVGGHANFTLSDDTLRAMGVLARDFGVGLHIHVGEAVGDEKETGEPLVARLSRLEALREDSLLAHCIHLGDDEYKAIGDAGAFCTHQARSNMNNAVGHAPVHRYPAGALLGTDGIGADMFAELQAAYFRGQEAGVPWGPAEFLGLLASSARYASRQLGVTLGKIAPGAQADLVQLHVAPGPPVATENLAAAMVFRLSSTLVRSVMVRGRWVMRDHALTTVDEPSLNTRAEAAASRLWKAMAKLAPEQAHVHPSQAGRP